MIQAIVLGLLNFASFSSLQALPFAVVAAIAVALMNVYYGRGTKRTVVSTIGLSALLFYGLKTWIYFGLPSLTGLFGGFAAHIFWMLVVTTAGGILACIDGDRGSRGSDRSKIAAGLPGIGVALLIVASVGVCWMNAVRAPERAAIANVTEKPATDNVPDTDPQHISRVTQSQAAFAGQQVIAKAGANFGSRFKTQPADYTKMSIQHHLWWVAPLIYQNGWQQFDFFGQSEYDTPGYIFVDAEDPNGKAEVRTGFHIKLSPDGWYHNDLYRYLYENGYSHGNLDDATLELDDNWQPYWTVTYTQPKLTTTGNVIQKVLVIDAQSGKINEYEPGNVPAWVDRVVSSDHVKNIVGDWARFLHASWFNPSGVGEMKIAGDPELVYNNADIPVWVIPVTSNNNSDNSSTGIVVYSTREQKGEFYPGLSGLGVGEAVVGDFQSVKDNLQHYPVESVQLYRIDGVPTWVAIYGQSHGNGTSSFAGIGLLDAKRLNSGNVIFAQNLEDALARYADWLANNDTNNVNVSQQADASKSVTAKIARIGSVLVNNTVMFTIIVENDPHIYTASMAVNPALPVMKEGDTIEFSYLNMKQASLPVRSLKDVTIGH